MINFIKNNWILLLIFIALIFLAYKFYKKTQAEKSLNSQNNQGSTNAVSNLINNVVSSNTGSVQTPPLTNNNTVKPPTTNLNSTTWKIGDKLYAGPTGVNTYNSPKATSSNIVKFYNKDEYIGTFLGNENGFTKIIVYWPTNSLEEIFGVDKHQVRYSLSNQIYSK